MFFFLMQLKNWSLGAQKQFCSCNKTNLPTRKATPPPPLFKPRTIGLIPIKPGKAKCWGTNFILWFSPYFESKNAIVIQINGKLHQLILILPCFSVIWRWLQAMQQKKTFYLKLRTFLCNFIKKLNSWMFATTDNISL